MTDATAQRPVNSMSRWQIIRDLIVVIALYRGIEPAMRATGVNWSAIEMPIFKLTWVDLVLALGIVWWFRRRGDDLASYGLVSRFPTWRMFGVAVVGAVTAVLVSSVTDPILTPLFGKVNTTRLDSVTGSVPMAAVMLGSVWTLGAFVEEFFYRGFLLTRLALLFGESRMAWGAALLLQAVAFGLAHAYQGPHGMIGVGLYGFLYGSVFLLTKRNLWTSALMHGLLDTIAVVVLYLGKV